jgi:hypothetical protein
MRTGREIPSAWKIQRPNFKYLDVIQSSYPGVPKRTRRLFLHFYTPNAKGTKRRWSSEVYIEIVARIFLNPLARA